MSEYTAKESLRLFRNRVANLQTDLLAICGKIELVKQNSLELALKIGQLCKDLDDMFKAR
jgi:hypothetical protein